MLSPTVLARILPSSLVNFQVSGFAERLLPTSAPAAADDAALGGNSPIHPMRVRKAARPTHIVPATLKTLNFPFRFDFRSSLVDWQRQAPQDFA